MEKFIYLLAILLTISIQSVAQGWQKTTGGYSHTLAIRTDGTLWVWGLNNAGQSGDGTNTNRNIPGQISCNTILPVTWQYVNGKWENNSDLIKWATASETNTIRFEIEHGTNGISYAKIGTAAAAE